MIRQPQLAAERENTDYIGGLCNKYLVPIQIFHKVQDGLKHRLAPAFRCEVENVPPTRQAGRHQSDNLGRSQNKYTTHNRRPQIKPQVTRYKYRLYSSYCLKPCFKTLDEKRGYPVSALGAIGVLWTSEQVLECSRRPACPIHLVVSLSKLRLHRQTQISPILAIMNAKPPRSLSTNAVANFVTISQTLRLVPRRVIPSVFQCLSVSGQRTQLEACPSSRS